MDHSGQHAHPAPTSRVADTVAGVTEASGAAVDSIKDAAKSAADAVKPKLRGWIHAGTFPLALLASIVLAVLAPAGAARISCIVFGISACLLFGTSAVYHRGTWSDKVAGILRRADHSNIFLIIAGTYTPLAVLLLPEQTAKILLITVWSGALLGLGARIIWLNAPRWVYVPIYLALGWVAVWFMPAFLENGGPAILWLVIAGGAAYTAGAIIYGLKKPNPSPRWFGFHEIFHILTVIGYGCHYVAILLAVLQLR